jgi:hypothetical protein
MKKLAVLVGLALQMALCSCNTAPTNNVTTTTNSTWEAVLTGGTGPMSQLNFVVTFSVTDTTGQPDQPLDVTSFSFFNQGQNSCFVTGTDEEAVSGTATLSTATTGDVTGTFLLNVTSASTGTALALTGNLTGTSNGTPTTTGTLSNGVVEGQWTLTPGTNVSGCNTGTASLPFLMCQGAATCTAP